MTEPQLSRLLQDSADRHDPGPPPYADIAARSAGLRQRDRRRTAVAVGVAAAAVVTIGGVAVATRGDDSSPQPAGDDTSLDLPTQPVPSAIMAGSFSGRLEVEGRCVYLDEGGGTRYPPVWPAGYTAELEGGRLTVFDGSGAAVAHDGDLVAAGGGYDFPEIDHPCLDGSTGIIQSGFRALPSTPIDLPTSDWRPGDDGADALATGTLELSDGCPALFAPGSTDPTPMVWPAGWTATSEGDRGLTLRDPDGQVVAHEGDRVSVGGGFGGRPAALVGCLSGGKTEPFSVQSEVTVAE